MKANRSCRLKEDEGGMLFNLLLTAGITVIIFFALMSIGTYINGAIGTSLVSTYKDNSPSGTINTIYWNNASGNGTTAYRNTSLPTQCTAGEIRTGSSVNVYNNGTLPIWFNLSANGNTVANFTLAATTWNNRTLATIITAGDVASGDTYVNYSWITNYSSNRVRQAFIGTYHLSADYRTSLENMTVDSLENVTANYNDALDIMTVTAIIMVITLPLAAIIGIKKLL